MFLILITAIIYSYTNLVLHTFTAAPPSRDVLEAVSIAGFLGAVVGLIIGAIPSICYAIYHRKKQ
jgi:hypothetical protein